MADTEDADASLRATVGEMDGDEMADTESGFSKVTFNLPTDDVETLKKLAKERKTSVTAVLRRALGTEFFLNEQEKNGAKVLLEEPSGSMQRIVRR